MSPYKDRGSWRAVVKIDGKRYTKSDPEWTKRDAQKWEQKERRKLLTPSSGMDFLTFSAKYLDLAESKVNKGTYREKKRAIKNFARFLGSNLPISEITPQHVQDYLLYRSKSCSANAANVDRKNLHHMWRWGQKIMDLQSNPIGKVDRFPHSRKPQYVPPEGDILKLRAAATAIERVFLDCYLCTGARKSEIFRLKWQDVNFEHRTITLYTRKTEDGSEKAHVLPMNQQLHDSLWWWWNNRVYRDKEYVWIYDKGHHAGKPFTTRRLFLPSLCKRAGIKEIKWHSLRRYVATSLSDRYKMSTKTIQRVLGHASERTTEVYLYNSHRDLEAVMELLSRESTTDCTTGIKKES